MEVMRDDLNKSLQEFKRENFKLLGPFAFLVYIGLSFVDSSLSDKGLTLFIGLRFLFILPTITLSTFSRRVPLKNIDLIIFISFLSAGLGVSIISYYLGGISSDYYFGLIIVSFVQYAFAPLDRGLTILLDVLLFTIFFSINVFPFEFPPNEIVKQVSNYLSFFILKIIVVLKSRELIIGALNKERLEQELESQRKIQSVLGELCHLFNNPLFISMSILKKIKKNRNLPDSEMNNLNKVFESNERMEKVLKKMLDITSKDDAKVDPKDFLNE